MKKKKLTLNEEISQMKRMMGKLLNEGFYDGDKVFDHFGSMDDIYDAINEKLEEAAEDEDELNEFKGFFEVNENDVMQEYEMAGGNNSMNASDAAAKFIIDQVRKNKSSDDIGMYEGIDWDREPYYGSHGGSSEWVGASGKSYGNVDWEGVDFDEKEYDSLDDLHSDYPELIDDKRTHGRHKWYGSGEKFFPSWQERIGKLKVRKKKV